MIKIAKSVDNEKGLTMEDFKAPKVPVTLHLTQEAAEILDQYASERNKGRFISALLVAQRDADMREGEELYRASLASSQPPQLPPSALPAATASAAAPSKPRPATVARPRRNHKKRR